MEESAKQMPGDMKQISVKLDILEHKTKIIDRQLKRELDNQTLWDSTTILFEIQASFRTVCRHRCISTL